MSVPKNPQIYHIVHVDRLESILADGCLWCDAEIHRWQSEGTVIGMDHIKRRRMTENVLQSHWGVYVGDCVPFYFCPRSVMLYILNQGNHPDVAYKGGQGQIVHLVADLREVVTWAEAQGQHWAFSLSNAGSSYFEDRNDLSQLSELDWAAIQSRDWRDCRERKQGEFLLERRFPWELVHTVGVINDTLAQRVSTLLSGQNHRPSVRIQRDWYY